MSQYRARAYHPKLGRFTSEDPMLYDAGDYNLFRYCHNDPVDMTDPMGLLPVDVDSETNALIQTAASQNYQAQRGEFFLWQYFRQPMERAEYATTVLRDNQTFKKSLSKPYTDGKREGVNVQDTRGKTSLVYTHIHPNDSTSQVTGSHLSDHDVALAIATGKTVQVSTPGGTQDRYRPSDQATWQQRLDDGGRFERRDENGNWVFLPSGRDTKISADDVERMAARREDHELRQHRFNQPVSLFNGRPL